LILAVISTRELERYSCFPEQVLFDKANKQTMLLPEWEAAIYDFISEHQKVHFDKLVSFFNLNEDEVELLYQHINTLKQLKLIELIE